MIIMKHNYYVHVWHVESEKVYRVLLPYGFLFNITYTGTITALGNVVDNTMNIQFGIGWRKGYLEKNQIQLRKIEKDVMDRYIVEKAANINYTIVIKSTIPDYVKKAIQIEIDNLKTKKWYKDVE